MATQGPQNPSRMLFRFGLYGFLKNQRYYEPFLMLFFLMVLKEDYFKVGLLIGFREVLINLLEVPSGAIADLWGRRRCMMFSFSAYIVSFIIFALSWSLWPLLAAMAFYALGDAFRTGTHKAMIFDYLRREGRASEKTRYYGITRSFSKMGSAVSVVIAAGLVFVAAAVQHDSGAAALRWLFIACIPPYLAGLVNFALYPKYLDGPADRKASVRRVVAYLFSVWRDSIKAPALRRLMIESMGYEGVYKVAKDYLQPIVKTAALALPLLAGLKYGIQRTAGLIVVVYVALHLAESLSSRRSDTIRRRLGGEERAARFLWWLKLVVFGLIAAGLGLDWCLSGTVALLGPAVAIAGFVALAVLQNLWRPLHLGRFDAAGDAAAGATILSVESQAKSLSAAVIAPVLGLAVNAVRNTGPTGSQYAMYVPVALTGFIFAAGILLLRRPAHRHAGPRKTQWSRPGGESGRLLDDED